MPRGHVFVASTGVIGEPLPAERIVAAMEGLRDGLAADGAERAARAIMTTDTFPKGAVARVDLGGVPVTITGFAKGSGMIAPDMATMLVFLFTDAAVAAGCCRSIGRARLRRDLQLHHRRRRHLDLGHAADGRHRQGADAADRRPPTTRGCAAFEAALDAVMRDLAQQVVRDGEGATKFVEVRVTGAARRRRTRGRSALAIANSPLVKTAVAGEDPNWGRIVMAVGKSGAAADRDRLTIRSATSSSPRRAGWRPPTARLTGAAYMKRQELVIGVDLGSARGGDVWTCDLTQRYIEINADYRS